VSRWLFDAVVEMGVLSTPGTPALMAAAHEKWGRTKAVAVCSRRPSHWPEQGFSLSPRLCGGLVRKRRRKAGKLRENDSIPISSPNGTPVQAGDNAEKP